MRIRRALRQAGTLCVVAIAASWLLGADAAHATTIKVDYALTLAGLPIGTASVAGDFAGDRYTLNATGQMTGLAGALSGGSRGAATATGAVGSASLASTGFAASGNSSSVTRTVQFGIDRGTVTEVKIEPPFELRPDRVPLTEADKRGIIDPLSALIGVAPKGRDPLDPAACDRTLPIFEGTQRFDITLGFTEKKPVKTPAYTGEVLVCHARYTPIAGHRPTRPAVKFMTDNRDMSVWLAVVPGTRVLVPVRISVATFYGTSLFDATSWTVR